MTKNLNIFLHIIKMSFKISYFQISKAEYDVSYKGTSGPHKKIHWNICVMSIVPSQCWKLWITHYFCHISLKINFINNDFMILVDDRRFFTTYKWIFLLFGHFFVKQKFMQIFVIIIVIIVDCRRRQFEFNWGVYQNCLIKIIIWYCIVCVYCVCFVVCAHCHMFVA